MPYVKFDLFLSFLKFWLAAVVCCFGRSTDCVEHYTCFKWCALMRMLPAGWLWGVCGPHCVLPRWLFSFGLGVSVWFADGPWLGGFSLCLSVGAGGCHVNKVTWTQVINVLLCWHGGPVCFGSWHSLAFLVWRAVGMLDSDPGGLQWAYSLDLHCVVVFIEMMPWILRFILFACVPLNLAYWPAWPVITAATFWQLDVN